MARSKLKNALDRHQGRDIKLEKQRKKEKEAQKRKAAKQAGRGEETEEEEEEVQGGVQLNGSAKTERTNVAKSKKAGKANGVKVVEQEDQWETDEDEEASEGEDDEDGMPDRLVIDASRLEDSDSEASFDEDEVDEQDQGEDENEEEEGGEDIPLSDLESVASEDKGDIIPHQRLTINNTSALLAAVHRIQLPISKMPFSEHQSVVTEEPVEIPDVEDDLNRELAFYKQSLSAVKEARVKLKKEGVPFSRPADYFAEMVKSEEHMGKIKKKLVDEAAGKKAAAEARRQRDLKKFGKQVQIARIQERAKEKRDTLEKINILKRKRQGADLTATNEEDLFDVELDNAAKANRSEKRGDGKSNPKRQKKDTKYGYGGKKRFAKSGDAYSSADMSGFSTKRMKGKTGGGASKRLGKSRRATRA